MNTADDDRDDPGLDEIARALAALPDQPDPAVRAAHLALAQAEFARMHGAAAPAREGWARRLWASVAGPGALGALTAAAAVGFVVLTPAGRGLLTDPFAVEEAGPAEVPAGKVPEAVGAAGTGPAAAEVETAAGSEAMPGAEAELAAESDQEASTVALPETAEEAAPGTEATEAAATESLPAEAPVGAAAETVQAPDLAAESVVAAPAPEAPPSVAATTQAAESVAADAPESARTLPAPGMAPEAPAEAARSLGEGADAASEAAGQALADAAAGFADGEVQTGGGVPGAGADRAAETGALVALAPAAAGDDAGEAPAGAEAAAAGMGDLAMADPVREALEAGRLPAPGEVRGEDLLRGAGIAPEAPEVLAAVAPWDPEAVVVVALLPFWPGQAARVDWAGDVQARAVDGGLPAEGPLPADLTVMAWVVAGGAPDGSPGTLGFRGPIPFAGEAEKVALPITVEGGPRAALAAAVVGWALLLRGEDLGAWRAGDAVALAQGAPETARLMRLSEPLLAR